MNYCVDCGSPIPDGQRTCSMCYGDIDHGKDDPGLMRDFLQDETGAYIHIMNAVGSFGILPGTYITRLARIVDQAIFDLAREK